jgi:CubicO group peptidase (beta-lactamase class C family)
MTTEAVTFGGVVEPGWQSVAEAFRRNFATGEDLGASAAVYHRGRKVVDIYGGSFDESGDRLYDDQTLQIVFSTTKGVTSIALAMLAQRGQLDYSQQVSHYWPEFAAHGKGEATVAQLLSHQCGLIAPDVPTTLEEALHWDTIVARLADTRPDWPIGSGHGYHAVTFGWLAGELLRRIDGRSPGQFVQDEISGPLGIDLWIGLPEEHEHRVSPLIGTPISAENADPAIKMMLEMFLGPNTRGGRTLFLGGALVGNDVFNRRDVHAAEIPAANGISNAAALAKLYAATMDSIDGVQLFDQPVRDLVRTTVTPAGEGDLCLIMPTTFGMGFMTHGPFSAYAGPGSFGHPGAGGSVAFAQPERELAFAYVMNTMATNLAGDLRAQRIIDAATAVIDAL